MTLYKPIIIKGTTGQRAKSGSPGKITCVHMQFIAHNTGLFSGMVRVQFGIYEYSWCFARKLAYYGHTMRKLVS